jgi:hypothetical protein
MKLGGWETLDMVVRYTMSVKFEDSLKVYEGAMTPKFYVDFTLR